jgi:hypothetical protein
MCFLFVSFTSTFAQTNQFVDTQNTTPLRWKSNKIKIALSSSLYSKSSNVDLVGAIKRSLRKWEAVSNIEFTEVTTDKLATSWKGKSGDGINLISIAPVAENLDLFEDTGLDVSANTRVFYNRKGVISEADILLNPFSEFSTDGTFGTFDIEATITHEIGHFLGLDHSIVVGSTMQTHQSRNGIYSSLDKISRNLSQDSIVGITSLYGEQLTNKKCCGGLAGKINAKSFSENTQIWIENSMDGTITAGFKLRQDGYFKFLNFPSGNYRIYITDSNELVSSQLLGEIEVKQNLVSYFNKTPNSKPKSFSIQYIGSNSQLSNVAVNIDKNSQNIVYVGGKNLTKGDIAVKFSSSELSVKTDSIIAHQFGEDLTVLSFELSVSERASSGNYAINLVNSEGDISTIVGGVTVVDGN